MKIKIASPKELNRLLDALSDDIVQANIYYRLFRDLDASREQYTHEFSQSETFWFLVMGAIRDAFLVRACRVYDKHDKSLNLVNLLDTVKANLNLFSRAEFRQRLKDNAFVESLADQDRVPCSRQLDEDIEFASTRNPHVLGLFHFRNNILAHRGAQFSLGKTQIIDDNRLTWGDLEALLNKGITIFNRYSSLFRASTHSCQMIGHDDYKNLLNCLRLGLQKQREELNGKIAAYRERNARAPEG